MGPREPHKLSKGRSNRLSATIKMYKLNILPVSLLKSPVSKNKMIFSHEQCDVCQTNGIKFEAVAYKGKFDYNALRYSNYTYKAITKMEPGMRQWVDRNEAYCTYYLCSEPCAMMLQLQLQD